MILVGDIGGTKTNLALFSHETGPHQPLAEATFQSGDYEGLEAMIAEFRQQHPLPIQAACFGVAGPITARRARITNLRWVIDEIQLAELLQIPSVRLINDLQAIASAVPILQPSDVVTIHPGSASPHGTIAVIAPGTGLGEAFLIWDGTRYQAYPSEGGHASFAPTDATQLDLLRYLFRRYDHVSYERVCSGRGIPNIYAYFRDCYYTEELPDVVERLTTEEDPTPVIIQAALDERNPSPLCKRTLDTFVSILGSEAGNLALKVLACGGVYLAGGIPPRIVPHLRSERFLKPFLSKGRFSDRLCAMPVHVILNPKAALLGAASIGLAGISSIRPTP